MDLILKTNIKYYLIDILIEKGFYIRYNNIIKNKDIKIKTVIDKKDIIEKLLEILNLDKDNLDDLKNIST